MTADMVRKVLNENGYLLKSVGVYTISKNKIIQIRVNTLHSTDDVKNISEIFKAKGYAVEINGFSCTIKEETKDNG